MSPDPKSQKSKHAPRAFTPDDPKVVMLETEAAEPERASFAPENTPPARVPAIDSVSRGLKWGGILLGAAASLAALGAGIWLDSLITGLVLRQDWIGWLALGLLGLAAFAALMIGLREVWALFRLRRLGRLRQDAESAERHEDKTLARRVSADLMNLYRSRANMAWGRSRLGEHERNLMDARETLILAERELISPLDADARAVLAAAAKRVSVLTVVSPAAVLDMAVVAAQNLRMLRRIATVYGARPGALGLFRLGRMVVAHIVLTGGLSLGDDLIQPLLGHRLVAKLSARLGEGLFNGALTARIGLAAIDVCRPLPFIEAKQPRLREVLADIALGAKVKI
ncbi:MAG TPA: TIGR01620 family protein [Rhizobiales bacterium]|nr:hypothetical protein BMS3Bbin10_02775 [bacterium BMS3Bbin10]HDO51983.1 TIGR01620 family protein [Hyphomicrobiales bacterium]